MLKPSPRSSYLPRPPGVAQNTQAAGGMYPWSLPAWPDPARVTADRTLPVYLQTGPCPCTCRQDPGSYKRILGVGGIIPGPIFLGESWELQASYLASFLSANPGICRHPAWPHVCRQILGVAGILPGPIVVGKFWELQASYLASVFLSANPGS